jgi:hypothetical protein
MTRGFDPDFIKDQSHEIVYIRFSLPEVAVSAAVSNAAREAPTEATPRAAMS